MKECWAGISRVIENNEETIKKAKNENVEEAGIIEEKITLIKDC